MKKSFRFIAASWGVVGILMFLSFPTYRLFNRAWEELNSGMLDWYHWLCVALSIGFMAYAEGYQGFQQSFSPRVAARAKYLREHASFLQACLAPLFCMGYFGASKRRQISSFVLTSMIVLLILLVSLLPQPWRGVVDMGVVVGLLWGIFSLSAFSVFAFSGRHYPYDPELSESLLGRLEAKR